MQSRQSNRAWTDSALFAAPIPADQDPALLLTELRALRPLMEQLRALEPALSAMRDLDMTAARVQQLGAALDAHQALLVRQEHAAEQLGRIEEVVRLLDELDVIVRRQ